MGERPYQLRLMGPFRLLDRSGGCIDIPSKRSTALLALLAMAPDGVRTRTWLQSMLWGSRGLPQAQASLRRELANLAILLEAAGAGALLVRERTRVALSLDSVAVDALELAAGIAPPARASYDDFLEGLDLADCEAFEDWLREQRAFCREILQYRPPEALAPPSAADVHGGPLPSARSMVARAAPGLPPKPSVAILPLVPRTSGQDDAALAAGIAEEIEILLVSFRTLFVVAGMSAAAASRRGLTATEIAAALGVRYLIHGSVERRGSMIKASVAIVDGETGLQIWSQMFRAATENLLELQEEIARAVAPKIHSRIDLSEMERGLARPSLPGDSYQLYWRANALFRQWDAASIAEATELCSELVEREPDSAWAASMAAFCHATAFMGNWTPNREASRRSAAAHYQRALARGGDDPTVLGYCAGTLVLIAGDLVVADRLVAHALNLLPGYQPTLFWGAWVDVARGNAGRARERFELGLRINPEAGTRPYTVAGIGIALLLQGDAVEAHAMLTEALLYIPTYPMALAAYAAAAGALGDAKGARRAADALKTSGGDQVIATMQSAEHRAILTAAIDRALGS